MLIYTAYELIQNHLSWKAEPKLQQENLQEYLGNTNVL